MRLQYYELPPAFFALALGSHFKYSACYCLHRYISDVQHEQGYEHDKSARGGVRRPERDATFLAEISPARHADRITAPLMIAQGANDPIVPPAESQQLVELLRARGRTVRYLLLPDEGHGFSKQANQIRAYQEMVAFLDEIWRRHR